MKHFELLNKRVLVVKLPFQLIEALHLGRCVVIFTFLFFLDLDQSIFLGNIKFSLLLVLFLLHDANLSQVQMVLQPLVLIFVVHKVS